METQIISTVDPQSIDSIQSYGPHAAADNIETDMTITTPESTQKPANVKKNSDVGLQCECSISVRTFIIGCVSRRLTTSADPGCKLPL